MDNAKNNIFLQQLCDSKDEKTSLFTMSKSGINCHDRNEAQSDTSSESLRRRLNKVIGPSSPSPHETEENERPHCSRKGSRRNTNDESSPNHSSKRIRSPINETREESEYQQKAEKQMEWISHDMDCDLQYVKCLLNNLLASLRQRVHLIVEGAKLKSQHVNSCTVDALRKMIADLQLFLRCLNRSTVSKQQIMEVCEQVKFMKKKLTMGKQNDRPQSNCSKKLGDSEIYRELSSLDCLLKQTLDNMMKEKNAAKKKQEKFTVEVSRTCERPCCNRPVSRCPSNQMTNRGTSCNMQNKEQELTQCLAKCLSKYGDLMDKKKSNRAKTPDDRKKKSEGKDGRANDKAGKSPSASEHSKSSNGNKHSSGKNSCPLIDNVDYGKINTSTEDLDSYVEKARAKELWCGCQFECICPTKDGGKSKGSSSPRPCKPINVTHVSGEPGNPQQSSKVHRSSKKSTQLENKCINTDEEGLIVVEYPGKCPPSMRLFVNDGEEFFLELPNSCSCCPVERPLQLPPGCYSRLKIVTDCHEYIVQLNRKPVTNDTPHYNEKAPQIYENPPQENAKNSVYTFPTPTSCSQDFQSCPVDSQDTFFPFQTSSSKPTASSHSQKSSSSRRCTSSDVKSNKTQCKCSYCCYPEQSNRQYSRGNAPAGWDKKNTKGHRGNELDSTTQESLSTRKSNNNCMDPERKTSEEIIINLEKKIEKILKQMKYLQSQSQLRDETLRKVLSSLPKVDRVEKLVQKLIHRDDKSTESVSNTSSSESDSEITISLTEMPSNGKNCDCPAGVLKKSTTYPKHKRSGCETRNPEDNKGKDHEDMKSKLEEIFSLLVRLVDSRTIDAKAPKTESSVESEGSKKCLSMPDHEKISPEMYEKYELKSGMENNINLYKVDKRNMRTRRNSPIPLSALNKCKSQDSSESEGHEYDYAMKGRTGGTNQMGILAPVPALTAKEAFATIVSCDGELKDAIRLGKSIKENSKKPTVIITGMNVSAGAMCTLGSVYDRVIRAKCDDPDNNTYLIITCWDLTQYKKCLLLSPNCVIIHECKKLFQQPELAVATPKMTSNKWEQYAIVLEPNARTAQRLRGFVSGSGNKMTFPQMLRGYFKNLKDLNLE